MSKKIMVISTVVAIGCAAYLSSCIFTKAYKSSNEVTPATSQSAVFPQSKFKKGPANISSDESPSTDISPEKAKAIRLLEKFREDLEKSSKSLLDPYKVVTRYEGRLYSDSAVYAEYRKLIVQEMIEATSLPKEPKDVFPYAVIYYISIKDSQNVLGEVLAGRASKDDEVSISYMRTLSEEPADGDAVRILVKQGDPGIPFIGKVLKKFRNNPEALAQSRSILEEEVGLLKDSNDRKHEKKIEAYQDYLISLKENEKH